MEEKAGRVLILAFCLALLAVRLEKKEREEKEKLERVLRPGYYLVFLEVTLGKQGRPEKLGKEERKEKEARKEKLEREEP